MDIYICSSWDYYYCQQSSHPKNFTYERWCRHPFIFRVFCSSSSSSSSSYYTHNGCSWVEWMHESGKIPFIKSATHDWLCAVTTFPTPNWIRFQEPVSDTTHTHTHTHTITHTHICIILLMIKSSHHKTQLFYFPSIFTFLGIVSIEKRPKHGCNCTEAPRYDKPCRRILKHRWTIQFPAPDRRVIRSGIQKMSVFRRSLWCPYRYGHTHRKRSPTIITQIYKRVTIFREIFPRIIRINHSCFRSTMSAWRHHLPSIHN